MALNFTTGVLVGDASPVDVRFRVGSNDFYATLADIPSGTLYRGLVVYDNVDNQLVIYNGDDYPLSDTQPQRDAIAAAWEEVAPTQADQFDEDRYRVEIGFAIPGTNATSFQSLQNGRILIPSDTIDRTGLIKLVPRATGHEIRNLRARLSVGATPFAPSTANTDNIVGTAPDQEYSLTFGANLSGIWVIELTFDEYDGPAPDGVLVGAANRTQAVPIGVFNESIPIENESLPSANGFNAGFPATNIFAEGATVTLINTNTALLPDGLYRLRAIDSAPTATTFPVVWPAEAIVGRRYLFTDTTVSPATQQRFIWDFDFVGSVLDSREDKYTIPAGQTVYIAPGSILIATDGEVWVNTSTNTLPYAVGGVPSGISAFTPFPDASEDITFADVFPSTNQLDEQLFVLEDPNTLISALAGSDDTISVMIGNRRLDRGTTANPGTDANETLPIGFYRYDLPNLAWVRVESVAAGNTTLRGEVDDEISTLVDNVSITETGATDSIFNVNFLGVRLPQRDLFLTALGVDLNAVNINTPTPTTREVTVFVNSFDGTATQDVTVIIPDNSQVFATAAGVVNVTINNRNTVLFSGGNLSRITYQGRLETSLSGDIEVVGAEAIDVNFDAAENRITISDQRDFTDFGGGEGFSTRGQTHLYRPPVNHLQRDVRGNGVLVQNDGGVFTTETPTVTDITVNNTAEIEFLNANQLSVFEGVVRGPRAFEDDEFITSGQVNDALEVRDNQINALNRILTTAITDTEIPNRYPNFRLRPDDRTDEQRANGAVDSRKAILNHMRQYRLEQYDPTTDGAPIFERAHALVPRNDGPFALRDFNRFGLHMTLSAFNRGDYRTDLANNNVRTTYPLIFDDHFAARDDGSFSIQQYSAGNAIDFRVTPDDTVPNFERNLPIEDISQPNAAQRALLGGDNFDAGQFTGYPGLINPVFHVQVQENFGLRDDGSVSSIPDNHRGIVSMFRFAGRTRHANVVWSLQNQNPDPVMAVNSYIELGFYTRQGARHDDVREDGWYFEHRNTDGTLTYDEVQDEHGTHINIADGKAYSMAIVLADYQRRRASDGTHRRVRIHYAVAELEPGNRGTTWTNLEAYRRIDTFVNAEDPDIGLIGSANPIIQFGAPGNVQSVNVSEFAGVISEVMVGYTDFSTFNLTTGEDDNTPGLSRFLTHGGRGGASENIGAYLSTSDRYYGLLNLNTRRPIAIERTNVLSVRVDPNTILKYRQDVDTAEGMSTFLPGIRIPFEGLVERPTPEQQVNGGALWDTINDADGPQYVRPATEVFIDQVAGPTVTVPGNTEDDDNTNDDDVVYRQHIIPRGEFLPDTGGSGTSMTLLTLRETADHNLDNSLTGGHPECEVTALRISSNPLRDSQRNYIELSQDFYDSELRTIIDGPSPSFDADTGVATIPKYTHGGFDINVHAIQNDEVRFENTSWGGTDTGFNVGSLGTEEEMEEFNGFFIFPQLASKFTSDRNALPINPEHSHLRLNFRDVNGDLRVREATIVTFNRTTGRIDWRFRTDAQLGSQVPSSRNNVLPDGSDVNFPEVIVEPALTLDDRRFDTSLNDTDFFVNIIENAHIPDSLLEVAHPASVQLRFYADPTRADNEAQVTVGVGSVIRVDATHQYWNTRRQVINNIPMFATGAIGLSEAIQFFDTTLADPMNPDNTTRIWERVGDVAGPAQINPTEKITLFLGLVGATATLSTQTSGLNNEHISTTYRTGDTDRYWWPTLRVDTSGTIFETPGAGNSTLGMWSNIPNIYESAGTRNTLANIINLIG